MPVHSYGDVRRVLRLGNKHRSVAATKCNHVR